MKTFEEFKKEHNYSVIFSKKDYEAIQFEVRQDERHKALTEAAQAKVKFPSYINHPLGLEIFEQGLDAKKVAILQLRDNPTTK